MDPENALYRYGDGFLVDVGETQLFYIDWPGATGYSVISRKAGSMVVRASMHQDDVCICLKWSPYKRIAQSRGTLCMIECEDLGLSPECLDRTMYLVGKTYVGVVVRTYIPGYTARSVWHLLTEDERLHLKDEVVEFVSLMSERRYPVFGYVQGRNLATSNPCTFLNYRILLSKILEEIDSKDMSLITQDLFESYPVLCHGALTLDHLILQDNVLVGVVGWSKADTLPETFDRMSYFFGVENLEFSNDWLRFLSTIPCFRGSVPPLFFISCMYYHYYRTLKLTPPELHDRIDESLSEVTSIQFPSNTSMEESCAHSQITEGDEASHCIHSESDTSLSSLESSVIDPFSDRYEESEVTARYYQSLSEKAASVQTWEFEDGSSTVKDIVQALL